MTMLTSDTLDIQSEQDLVTVRQRCRALAKDAGFRLVDQTKLVTAASELARNTLTHGGGGSCQLKVIIKDGRTGMQLTFKDQGPGMENVERALQDGYTSASGLGYGLGGARRLVDHMDIDSTPGKGTVVIICKWL